jgi:hypothetical protein
MSIELSRSGAGRAPKRLTLLGAAVPVLLVITGNPAAAQPDGHDHTFGDVPVVVGPLVLRVTLLVAVFAVAGFAMLRAFLGEPGRTTAAVVAVSAATAVLLEYMLGGVLEIPQQAAVLVLAFVAVPVFLAFARTPGAEVAGQYARRAAPVIIAGTAIAAMVEFVRAVLSTWAAGATMLNTGIVLALVGLSWLTVELPRSRVATAVHLVAGALGMATIAGIGFAIALSLPSAA